MNKPNRLTKPSDKHRIAVAPFVLTCDAEAEGLALPLAPALPEGEAPAPAPAVVLNVAVDPAASVADEAPLPFPSAELVTVLIPVGAEVPEAMLGDWNVTGPKVFVVEPAFEAEVDAETTVAVEVAWVLPPPPFPDEIGAV